MRSSENVEKLIRNAEMHSDPEVNQAVLKDLLYQFDKTQMQKPAVMRPSERRIIMKNRITKLTAATVIIVGISISVSYVTQDQQGIALGDVVKAMQQVKTVTWTESAEVSPPDDENTIQVSSGHICRHAYKAPNHKRREVTQNLIHPETKQIYKHKHVEIIDRNAGKKLSLDPQKMTAALYSFEPVSGEDPLLDVFLNPKRNMPPDAESLGSKQIGDREIVGFRMHKTGDYTYFWSGETTDIWVDTKTKRLVLVETTGAKGRVVYTLKDFVFDQELDDALFSLETPEGYKQIAPPPIFSITPEEE